MHSVSNSLPEQEPPILPASVPVLMPELPLRLELTHEDQLKAISDPTRSRILGVIQHHPATSKQIADHLRIPPGTIGHHLHILEETGLAQVIARRQIRGTVAKYYTRTARLYDYNIPHETMQENSPALHIVTQLRDELADVCALNASDFLCSTGFPHARLSLERAQLYQQRLEALIADFVQEPLDQNGQIYGLGGALFLSPTYLQAITPSQASSGKENEE